MFSNDDYQCDQFDSDEEDPLLNNSRILNSGQNELMRSRSTVERINEIPVSSSDDKSCTEQTRKYNSISLPNRLAKMKL